MEQQRILLDVGGESFVLNEPSAILKGDAGVLESIKNPTIPWDNSTDGTIFLDRDPTFFQYILNYFHNASLPKECLSPANMKSIMREAVYYSLEGLSTFMSGRIKDHYTKTFNMRGKVAKHLAIYLLDLQEELRKIHQYMSNDQRHSKRERSAMIKRIFHLVNPKERDLFSAFVEEPTLRSTCLQLLDELIAYCSKFSPLYIRDVPPSTAHLENELVVNGWNTWQHHPPSHIMYDTPKFALKHVKGTKARRRRRRRGGDAGNRSGEEECGCYLCTEYANPKRRIYGTLTRYGALNLLTSDLC
jgi:hypothetical protein